MQNMQTNKECEIKSEYSIKSEIDNDNQSESNETLVSNQDHNLLDNDNQSESNETLVSNQDHNLSDNDNQSESNETVVSNQDNRYFFSINIEKSIYVITQDDQPLFYVDTNDKARVIMWDMARNYRSNWFANYNTYIREGSNTNKIEITGNYKYFLISYEKILSTFKIYEIHELLELL